MLGIQKFFGRLGKKGGGNVWQVNMRDNILHARCQLKSSKMEQCGTNLPPWGAQEAGYHHFWTMSVDQPGAGLPHHIINNIQYPQKYSIQ